MNILFDLDGTLTDPREGIVGCIKHALSTLNAPIPPESELESFIGPPLRDVFAQLLSGDSGRVEAAVAAYRDRFTALGMFENAVYDGIPEVLDSLVARDVQLYVATSKPRVYAEQILVHFGLSRHFVAIYGSELSGALSDKGELIAHVLETAALRPAETVMVGDRLHDIRGARRNQVLPIGVLWGYGSREELSAAGAERLFERPDELQQLVA
jgi:phosphoglycolate phosphatase